MKTAIFKTVRADNGEILEIFELRPVIGSCGSRRYKQSTLASCMMTTHPELFGSWLSCNTLAYYRSLWKIAVKILPIY